MNIVVVQYWTENISYSEYTKAINEKYCKEKNYIYHIESNNEKILKEIEDRAITWYKPKLINEVFDLYNPDYILFLDADAIICDNSYRIEEFIDNNFDIICTEDHGPSKINAGVFIMKNNSWVKKFLINWWDICEEIENGYYKNGLWHDQTCFGLLMDKTENVEKHIKIIENNKLNGRVYKDKFNKNFIFHAFSYGFVKNRTIDLAYYDIFNEKIDSESLKTMNDLSQIFFIDKSYDHDYYNRLYDKIFNQNNNKLKKILEFSSHNYHNSFKILYNFFKDSKIYGAFSTINDDIINDENIISFTINQSNIDELYELKNKINEKLDIIIDDGTHKMFDQQKTLAIFFEKLNDDGVYILEDLHTSLEIKNPEKNIYDWGDSNKITTLEMLENFNKTNKIISEYLTKEECLLLENNISSVDIYYDNNMNSIVATIKKTNKKINNMTLSEIANFYPTDKNFTHNYYNNVYETYFNPIKDNVKKVCEIGIGGFSIDLNWYPGNSLKVWRDYFKNAEILGLDIKKYEIDDLDRIKIDYLDQSKRELVIEYSKKLNNYDIIIDDGSHNVFDQQITLVHFLKSLKSGGIYVLEDLHSSIEVKIPEKANLWGWGNSEHTTPLEILEEFKINKKIKSNVLTQEEIEYLENNIENVEIFYLSPTSITSIIIKK